MLKSYFKIAWRNFKHNKIFSFINIIGLSAGLACCMLITLFILNEINYDKYQKNADNIYQVGTTFIQQGKEESMPNTYGQYVGFNLDVGHYFAGTKGLSPLPVLEKYHDRIVSLHMKDRTADGKNLPWGQGQTPLKEILQLH